MIVELIKELDFFKSLDDKQILTLSSISIVKSYKTDTILHYENTELNRLEFLLEGLVKSYKIDKHENEILLYYIEKNTLITPITSLKSSSIISYSNIATIEESKIISVDYLRFKELFLDKNILSNELSNQILKQSNQLQELINREFIYDSVSKVAMMIDKDLTMFNRLKRHDIALVLHIQPSTLSRVLNRLKRDKIIDIDHKEVLILDSKSLKAIYEEKSR